MKVNYGEIYWIDFGDKGIIGSEQHGVRPGIIVQNELGNKYSPTINVVPLTTNIIKGDKLPVHVFIPKDLANLNKDSVALIEQIRTIDKMRLGNYIGKCDENTIIKIKNAIAIQLNMETLKYNMIDIIDLVESISNNNKISDKSKLGLTSKIKKYFDMQNINYDNNVYAYAKELKQNICLV